MRLCENCLETNDSVRDVEVGPEQGSQRDPYRQKRELCGRCAEALIAGDWGIIRERYAESREVSRASTS